jgi:hypothetical protein
MNSNDMKTVMLVASNHFEAHPRFMMYHQKAPSSVAGKTMTAQIATK